MTKALSIISTILILVGVAPAAKEHAWLPAFTVDAKTAREYVPVGVTAQAGTAGTSTWAAAQLHSMTIQETQLVIVSPEFLFLVNDTTEKSHSLYGIAGRAIANHKRGCRIIVNDPIMYYVEKSTVYVIDADGRECKLDLIRQERITAPSPPVAAVPSKQ